MVNTPIVWKYEWDENEDHWSLSATADSHHNISEDIEKVYMSVCKVTLDLVREGDECYSLVNSMTAELVLTWLGYGDLFNLLPESDVRRVVMNCLIESAKIEDERWEKHRAYKLSEVLTA